MKNKKRSYKYAWGGNVDPNLVGGLSAIGGNLLGSTIGQDTGLGGFLSGAGSAAGLGASIGSVVPGIGTAIGAIGGGLIGGIGGLIGAGERRREQEKLQRLNAKNKQTNYNNRLDATADGVNENPYGNMVFADGGPVPKKTKSLLRDNTKVVTPNIQQRSRGDGWDYLTNTDNFNYSSENVNAMNKMLNKYGNPKINLNKEKKKASYLTSDNSMSVNRDAIIPDILAELAHSNQFQTRGSIPFDLQATFEKLLYGNKATYNKKGTVEYEAHNIIQPKLEKEFRDLSFIKQQSILEKIKDESMSNKMANGGLIPDDQINIEEGELQIDPTTGKILRKYEGINPETGGLYKPHSKGKDTNNNFVTAEPGTFIITKKLSKDYEDAMKTNDKIRRDTILQNIKNVKDSKNKSDKMALGSFVDPPLLAQPRQYPNGATIYQQMRGLPNTPFVSANTGIPSPGVASMTGNINIPSLSGSKSSGMDLGNLLDNVVNYAPSLLNIGQGLFGKVEQQADIQPNINPYTKQILSNLPQDVNLNPLINRINRNQTSQFNQIDNTTSSNPIARANKNNVFANTQNQLADVYMQEQQLNNGIRSQRGSIYNNLGQQTIAEQNRAQQINMGINESNIANRAAKSNLLGTGLSQLQQVYQNQRLNKSKQSMDKYKIDLLKQMFPNLRYYGEQFGEDAINQLIGG